MDVFLSERRHGIHVSSCVILLGRADSGDDDLQCFRVGCYALLRFTGVRSEMTLLILQHCFDPLYLLFGQYPVAPNYQCTTALFVVVESVRDA